MVEFEYEELVKATENFCPSRIIGKGSHGWVFKGKLKNDKMVAIKKPLHDCHEALEDKHTKLENEIRVLSCLTQTQTQTQNNVNPYIIRFLGSSRGPDKKNRQVLVMELMPNGSLHDLLHKAPPPSWPKRLEIALQIARAVHSLHERRPRVIHRDIKSANVLFDSNWDAKLADFGLSVLLATTAESLGQPAGTIGYLDPGYTTPCKLSPKNDVYSFGVLLLEIISGRKALDVCRAPASISEWAAALIEDGRIEEICDARVSLPPHMAGTIRRLLIVAASCVSIQEECRPSIGEIVLGMENCYSLQPIGLGTSLLRRLILMARRRKLTKSWRKKISAIGN